MGTSHKSYVLLFLIFLSILVGVSTTTREREGQALVNWKNSLAPSPYLDSWSLANFTNLCHWTGIICTSTGTVSDIYLFGRNLEGTLAEFSFTSFPNLTLFNIRYNRFTGPIPPQIENLKELEDLDFFHNSLNGSIPYQVSHLQKLRTLDLGSNDLETPDWSNFLAMPFLALLGFNGNQLEGKFPDFIINCHNLTVLDLSDNNFTGPMPKSVFNNLHNLETLLLGDNYFQGLLPPNISKLTRLTELHIQINEFSGSIPEDIGMLHNLKSLALNENSFEGSLPSTIGQLTELRSLYIAKNHLNSSIPPELSLCTNLRYLDLSSNKLTGTIPSEIGNLTLLETLFLQSNLLSGRLPDTISNLKNLSGISLHDNMFSSNIPRDFGRIMLSLAFVDLSNNNLSGDTSVAFGVHPNLKYINLSGNQFSGELSPTICKATFLEILDMSSNSLSGSLPHCLGNFSNELTVLSLHNNLFRGTIPPTFTTNCQLRTLNMNNNQFEGSVPRGLANCKQLRTFDIGNNELSDTFPLWLVTFPELQVLVLRSNRFHGTVSIINIEHPFPMLRIMDLSHNEFTGHLPVHFFNNFKPATDSYGTNTYVRYTTSYYEASVSLTVKGAEYEVKRILYIYTAIDMSFNKFHGEVPKGIGQLKSLKLLNLSYNSLTGAIPEAIGNMMELESLDLSSNHLTGDIPRQLTRLTFLGTLNLSENHLTGAIPQGKQFSTFNNDTYHGNSELCGFPLTKKCTDEREPTLEVADDEDNWFNWEVILIGYGSGLICGLSMGYIVFSATMPIWFVKYTEMAHQCWRRSSKKNTFPRRRT